MDDRGNKPRCDRADATAIVKRLRANGHEAYFAGGCVRDLLLGLEPKDWDVATDAPPNRVRELFSKTEAVGAAFGVILVRHGRSVVEVATFRSDGSYLDGRRPSEVRFTTAEEDAQRRDFTINGLFLDPLEGDRVIDYVGGKEDLAARKLRAIGDPSARFAEDHLRLLRAVRFAARFGLEIAPATAMGMQQRAELLKGISPERIAGGALVRGDERGLAQWRRFLAGSSWGAWRGLREGVEGVGIDEAKIEALKRRIEELEGTDVAPLPLISGDDLERAGMKPGPAFKKILDAVYDEQLEGRVKSQQEAMDFAMRQARGGSSA